MINQFFLTSLTELAGIFGGNYGFAIIAFTVIIRSLLLPIIIPSMKSQRKMLDLKTDVDALKKKYGHDKKLLQEKQLELYQKNNVNPLAGCLPQIVQAILFIAFYRFLIVSLNNQVIQEEFLHFFYLSLHQPDPLYALPVLAAASQFVLAVMLRPATDTTAEKKLAAQTKTTKDDNKAQDMSDMAQVMQSQTMFIMPLLIGFFAANLPSGMSIYWITSSVYSIIQQFYVTGPGGLSPYLAKLGINISSKDNHER